MQQQPIKAQSDRAKIAMQRWDELRQARMSMERDWEDIARLIRPQRGGFGQDDNSARKMEKPLSSAPIMAQVNFASGTYGSLINPANRWMGMKMADPDLNKWKPMKNWNATISQRVLASFRPAVSPFYDAGIQLFSDIAAFGNAAQYDEMDLSERKIMDVTVSLSEVVWDIDFYGRVSEVVRRFKLSPVAALRHFGEKALPGKIRDMVDKHDPGKITFFQHIKRNDTWEKGKLGVQGKRWVSFYACEIENTLVRERGYDEMPFLIPRWEVDSGHSVGTGPGFIALASARVVQQMDAATIRAAQFAADAPILTPDREVWPLEGVVRPGAIIYGGVNPRGDRMVHRMDVSGAVGLTIQEKTQKIEEIRDAFHYSLMNLAGRTGMTATEVMAIQEERLRLMAPHNGRVQHEFLAPKIERRFLILWRAGQLPPPPEGTPKDAALDVEYTSAAAAAQRSAEGNAVTRILQDVGALGQIDPTVVDRFDAQAALEVLQEARGAPPQLLRSREDAEAIGKARQQQIQQQQQMAMASQGAGVMRDVAQAGAAMSPAEGGAQ